MERTLVAEIQPNWARAFRLQSASLWLGVIRVLRVHFSVIASGAVRVSRWPGVGGLLFRQRVSCSGAQCGRLYCDGNGARL